MKKAKKFLVSLLALAGVSAFALGMVACGDDSTGDTTTPTQKTEIEQVYDSYVEYATANGQTPLDYETWLATIKGATGAQGPQGVGIESVEVDEDGMMVITLTNGTVLPAIELPTGEPIEKGATRNLHYQKIAGKEEYRVIGLGLAAESEIVISSTYNGLPVTEIGDYAFEMVTYITSVTIPDSVTTIGAGAFYECCGLTNLTIPNSVTTIGAGAFSKCTGLTSITIPDSVTTIENGVFRSCINLTSVTIPDSVTTIGDYAFYNTGYYNDINNWDGYFLYLGTHLLAFKGEYAYKITVCTDGGYGLRNVEVSLYDGENLIADKMTSSTGNAYFIWEEDISTFDEYEIKLSLPNGWKRIDETTVYKTSRTPETDVEINVISSLQTGEMPSNKVYSIGDVMYDFTVETSSGSTFTLSEALEEKDMVLLNFWASWCSPCTSGLPAMQNAYERTGTNGELISDNVAILALSTSDNQTAVATFKEENGLSFDMAGNNDLTNQFETTAIPVYIVIDRYGMVAYMHVGSITSSDEYFALFEQFIGDDYKQKVVYDE